MNLSLAFLLWIKPFSKLMFHSCLDRLEELLGKQSMTVSDNDMVNAVKKWQRGSNWLGIVNSIEDYDIYGYATASSIKILAMMERVPPSNDKSDDAGGGSGESMFPFFSTIDTSTTPTSTTLSKETDIKLLFVSSNEVLLFLCFECVQTRMPNCNSIYALHIWSVSYFSCGCGNSFLNWLFYLLFENTWHVRAQQQQQRLKSMTVT